jgi:hypothetical protein
MIYLEEHKHRSIECPYCKSREFAHRETYIDECFITECGMCKSQFKIRKETSYFIAKDCELNGGRHKFEQVPDDFSPTIKEICTECEALRCN